MRHRGRDMSGSELLPRDGSSLHSNLPQTKDQAAFQTNISTRSKLH